MSCAEKVFLPMAKNSPQPVKPADGNDNLVIRMTMIRGRHFLANPLLKVILARDSPLQLPFLAQLRRI